MIACATLNVLDLLLVNFLVTTILLFTKIFFIFIIYFPICLKVGLLNKN